MRGRVLVLGLAAAVLAMVPAIPMGAVTIGQLQHERQQAQTELGATRAAFAETASAVDATLHTISTLNTSLAADQERVTLLRQHIVATRRVLNVTTLQLAAAQKRLGFESGLLTGQVRLMEEHGAVGYLDVVLGANSFSQFISRLYLMGQLATMAGNLVTSVQHTEHLIAAKKAALARQAASLAALEAAASAAARAVARTLGQQRIQEAQLAGEESQQQQLMQSLTATISHLTSQIAQIEALVTRYQGGSLSLHALFRAMYPLVAPIAAQFSLPPALVIAVITEESGGDASAVSTANAIGLMQVEPGTAAAMGYSLSDLYNPQDNVVIGCTYLSNMLDLFGHSASAAANVTAADATPPGNALSYLSAALAAYNAGPGAVENYGLGGLFAKPWGVQEYVTNIESLYLEYSSWGTP